MNFTKDSSLLLHAIHSLFYWRILKKIILSFGFKNPHKKIRVTRKRKKLGEKTRQKLESEKTRVYAQKPRLKMPFKNFISGKKTERTPHSFFLWYHRSLSLIFWGLDIPVDSIKKSIKDWFKATQDYDKSVLHA